jgi:hypothetical protein
LDQHGAGGAAPLSARLGVGVGGRLRAALGGDVLLRHNNGGVGLDQYGAGGARPVFARLCGAAALVARRLGLRHQQVRVDQHAAGRAVVPLLTALLVVVVALHAALVARRLRLRDDDLAGVGDERRAGRAQVPVFARLGVVVVVDRRAALFERVLVRHDQRRDVEVELRRGAANALVRPFAAREGARLAAGSHGIGGRLVRQTGVFPHVVAALALDIGALERSRRVDTLYKTTRKIAIIIIVSGSVLRYVRITNNQLTKYSQQLTRRNDCPTSTSC